MKKIMTIMLAVVAVTTAGCSTALRMGQFTAASSKHIKNFEFTKAPAGKAEVQGESCMETFLSLYSKGTWDDSIQRAMDDAIAKGQSAGLDGDIIVDARVDQTFFSIPVLYAKNCTVVRGSLVSLKK